jgi:hypothetical protein
MTMRTRSPCTATGPTPAASPSTPRPRLAWAAPSPTTPTSSGAADYVWTNSGTITIAKNGAAVDLGGVFTAVDFEDNFQQLGVSVTLGQDTVYLTGTMDNSAADNQVSGGVLVLGASNGPNKLPLTKRTEVIQSRCPVDRRFQQDAAYRRLAALEEADLIARTSSRSVADRHCTGPRSAGGQPYGPAKPCKPMTHGLATRPWRSPPAGSWSM